VVVAMTLLLYLGVVVVERYDLYAVCILETDVKAVVVVNNCTTRAKKAMSLIFTFALLVLTCIGINEKFPHHPIVKHAKFVHNEAVGALNGEHSYKITVSKEAKEKTVS